LEENTDFRIVSFLEIADSKRKSHHDFFISSYSVYLTGFLTTLKFETSQNKRVSLEKRQRDTCILKYAFQPSKRILNFYRIKYETNV
jgi:hypothetical protein